MPWDWRICFRHCSTTAMLARIVATCKCKNSKFKTSWPKMSVYDSWNNIQSKLSICDLLWWNREQVARQKCLILYPYSSFNQYDQYTLCIQADINNWRASWRQLCKSSLTKGTHSIVLVHSWLILFINSSSKVSFSYRKRVAQLLDRKALIVSDKNSLHCWFLLTVNGPIVAATCFLVHQSRSHLSMYTTKQTKNCLRIMQTSYLKLDLPHRPIWSAQKRERESERGKKCGRGELHNWR